MYFFESHLKLKDSWPALFKFVDSAASDHKAILETKFTPGTCTLRIMIARRVVLEIRLFVRLQ